MLLFYENSSKIVDFSAEKCYNIIGYSKWKS